MQLEVKFKTTKVRGKCQMQGSITVNTTETNVTPLAVRELVHRQLLPEYPLESIQITKITVSAS